VALAYARQQFADLPEGIALCDEARGIYEMGMGNFADAQSCFEQSLAYHLEADNGLGMGLSYYYLGRLYMLMDEPEMAADFIAMALQIGEEAPDRLLHLKAQIALAEFWIYQQGYETALELIETAEELLRLEVDDLRRAYLWCDRAEALFGLGQYDRSLEVLKREAIPQMRQMQHPVGCAIAKEIRGRILLYRLMGGESSSNEEIVETIEDIFLDSSMVFEQQGMKRQFASALYHLAQLYRLATGLPNSYQYQGKQLRSLELALSVLQQQPMGNGRLIAELEALLNEAMGMAR
jgi:tetratricopeptide (TPR) repeat protein